MRPSFARAMARSKKGNHTFPRNCIVSDNGPNQRTMSFVAAHNTRNKKRCCFANGIVLEERRSLITKATSTQQKRKKKRLTSGTKITTKDRLSDRLSMIPSRRKDFKMIQSPEELVQKLTVGLDMARAAARETMSSWTDDTSRGRRNFVNKPGIVMDANWWFWNLLLAVSPAILIGLYCEFSVKPEMKRRYLEQKEKEAMDTEEMETSVGDRSLPKTSKMRERRQAQRIREHEDGQTRIHNGPTESSHSSSQIPLNHLEDMVGSYANVLLSFYREFASSSPKSSPDDVFEQERNMTDKSVLAQEQNRETQLQLQLQKHQQELLELQQQMQTLRDQMGLGSNQVKEENQRKREEHQKDDESSTSVSSTPRLSRVGDALMVSIQKSADFTVQTGKFIGRKVWFSCRSWLGNSENGGSFDAKQNLEARTGNSDPCSNNTEASETDS